MNFSYYFIIAIFTLAFLISGQAHAVCSAPVGVAGETVFNTDEARLQYCNGVDWIGFPKVGGGSGPDWSGATAGATLNNPAPADNDFFSSRAVALSGTLAVIGARSDDPGGVGNAGTAYVFNVTTGNLVATLDNPNPTTSDGFGATVAISGAVAVVGAELDDPTVSGEGIAYVFDATTGNLVTTLSNPSPNTDDWFGNGLAVSGTVAVVGAKRDDPSAVVDAGTAYVFDTTTGNLITTLNNPNPTASDWFGTGIAVSGDVAVVGAMLDDPGGVSAAGAAYVFDTTTGNLISTLNNPNPISNDNFGENVAVDGTIAVVGAKNADPGGVSNAGAAYVFDTTTGTLIATLNSPSPGSNHFFGSSVAVSGTVAVVGTPNWPGASPPGIAHVFDTTTGNLLATLSNPDPTASDGFGVGVAISGGRAVVGAQQDDPSGFVDAGTAYGFSAGVGSGCSTPAGAPGQIVYHSDHRVLAWCDGSQWYATGPISPPGPNGGCTGPVGTGGDTVFHGDYCVLQYCDGDTWRVIGRNQAAPCACDPNAGVWQPQMAAEANLWLSVTHGNGLFVAVSQLGTNQVMTSPDGITWTARTAAEANSWASVAYGNGLFVAVAQSGINRVMTSPDGITWTARTAAEANSWASVTYGNGLFVAVSMNGTNQVMTSPDGVTWTARTAAQANTWYSVTYGNGLYVAVSWNGSHRVMTSSDGITWTAETAAEANTWYSVAYGDGLFVAVSSNGTNRVMTSPDGVTWTAQTAAQANTWYFVTYGDGLFVAVSMNGTNRVMTSPDGITWTARTAAEANSWASVAYGNGLFVAVALDGTNRVMTSSCLGQ